MPGKRSSDPEKSTHVWRGNIPSDLALGQHTIEIKATDMSGKTHTANSNYRIDKVK
jgi:hypothetical protein